jgi:hypothetical protein
MEMGTEEMEEVEDVYGRGHRRTSPKNVLRLGL